MATLAKTDQSTPKEQYVRFSRSDRMEHWVLLISFTMLGVTGLPQRYAEYQIAKDWIDVLGGIESVRFMHRFFATMLMALSIYHGGVITYKIYVRGVRLSMLPSLKDAQDAIGVFMYNIGLRKQHPKMPRFNFGEKMEYLAVVWGTVIMIITGFMLWNPIATAKILPGSFIPAARLAHSAEALLAIAAIILWHMYNVHIKRFNKSMFTGKISHEAMEEEHGEELEQRESGQKRLEIPAEIMAKRHRVFSIYAPIMTIILVAGLFYFVSFEDTALETVPRLPSSEIHQINVEEGDIERGAELWVELHCVECHGETGEGAGPFSAIRDVASEPQEFAIATRRGPADMPAYNVADVSDEGIADLYVWFLSVNEP